MDFDFRKPKEECKSKKSGRFVLFYGEENFMEEQIDVLDAQGRKTGEIRSRRDVHKFGLWHRTVHIWFVDKAGLILFQQRAHDKLNNPGLFDTSCAGHISAGDSSLDSAVREIREELGLKKNPEDLKYLFEAKHESILNGGTYLDNEFYDTYVSSISDEEKKRLRPQPHEVDDFYWFSKEEFRRSLLSSPEKFVSHPKDFDYLLK